MMRKRLFFSMNLLYLFAFLSGIATIIAPCIWPLLPIILSATTTSGKWRPLGIVTGISFSFFLATLLLSFVLRVIPFNPEVLRLVGASTIVLFGLTLVIPSLGKGVENLLSRLTRWSGQYVGRRTSGFGGGLVIGGALGLLWSPCAGPILATVAAVAATQSLNQEIIFLTLSFVIGLALPLYVFAWAGQKLFLNLKFLSPHTEKLRQVFGIIMIMVAFMIYTRSDQALQNKMIETYPACGVMLGPWESNSLLQEELLELRQNTK